MVELREDHPEGTLLDTITIPIDDVPSSWEWTTFDFDDVTAYPGAPGRELFIVIPPAPSGVTTSFGYEWAYAFGDQCPEGSFWFTRDGGSLWRDISMTYEFTFKIYAASS